MGDEATVYFPSLEKSMRATVTAIDRTKGFHEEIARRYSWRSPEDRSAQVSLTIHEDYAKVVERNVTPGLPAIVLFDARSTSPILAAIWRKVSSLLL